MAENSGTKGPGDDGSKEKSKLVSINGGRRFDKTDSFDPGIYDNLVSEQRYYDDQRRLRTKLNGFVFEKMNFPKRFWGINGPDIPLKLRPIVKDWLSKWEDFQVPDHGLFFYGPPDKSEILFAVSMKEVMRRNHTTFTISALELSDFILRNPEMTEYEAFEKLCRVNLLGVYNFGREHRDNFGTAEGVFSKVFNRRRDDAKPIVFSTELLPSQIRSSYLPQTYDGVFFTSKTVEAY